MTRSLLQSDQVPPALLTFIADRLSGNPFFLEEVVNALVDAKTLIKKNGRWVIRGMIADTAFASGISAVIAARPSVAVPLDTWARIRPRPTDAPSNSELVFNIVAVQLENPAELTTMADLLQARVNNIEAVDVVTAYESAPGYSEQQSTIQTQRGFTLLIGVLVVGGFFQIQTLQKVVQVGVLKALGASNRTVALATTFQIVVTNFFGVLLGGLATLLLVLGFPDGIPITFEGSQVQVALITLLLIGPLGGLMSIRLLTRVEPLTALGLSS